MESKVEVDGYDPNKSSISKKEANDRRPSYIYRQDIVRSKTEGKTGVVIEVAGDSDSDSSSSDDTDDYEENTELELGDPVVDNTKHLQNVTENNSDNDGDDDDDDDDITPLPADHVRVLWMDESETTQTRDDVEVIDRGFLHGDYVTAASESAGQVGVVIDVNISVDLSTIDGTVIENISSKDLRRVRDLQVGDYVILGPWLGRIDDVLDNVTVMFDDGSVCKVMKADTLRLKPAGKNLLEDAHYTYYPGQRVKASSSSVFKNSRWLSGLWKASRLEGTVTNVTAASAFVYWIASAGYGPDCSVTPSEEQNPKNLKLLSCFSHANWEFGDCCLLPSPTISQINKTVKSESESDTGPEESVTKKSTEPVSWPLRRKKVRKVMVKKDKRSRKKEENYEKALHIINTKTRVDVAWQDGTVKRGLDSISLIPVENPGDHEFVSEQYVVEKPSDGNDDDSGDISRVGVVKSVNAKERTACVRWLKSVARAEDPKEFDKEEVVSVYELEGHQDYDYCYGDVAVRLTSVTHADMNSDSPNLEACTEFSDLSWVGNITGLGNGDIEVTWADGMVSMV